jgi:hypothetical protein
MLTRAKRQQLSIICAVAALVAASAASSAAATKVARGAIYVHLITKHGKPDLAALGFQICASKTPRASIRTLKSCATVREGQAALTIPAGVWYLHSLGGRTQGPCYNRRNDGARHAACSPVRVASGKTKTVRWYVPRSR